MLASDYYSGVLSVTAAKFTFPSRLSYTPEAERLVPLVAFI